MRNICAHYGRIYNAKLSKIPILYKEYTQVGIGNNRIYGVLLCLKHLLKNDVHWNLFVDKIELLFDKYQYVKISTMAFPFSSIKCLHFLQSLQLHTMAS